MGIEDSISNNKIEYAKIRKAILNVHSRQWMGYILLATDMLSLIIASFIAMQVHLRLIATIDSYNIGIILLLGATLAYLFLRRGLYPPVGMHYADELRHIITTTSLAFLIMTGMTIVSKTFLNDSRLVLILTWLLCWPLIPFTRYVVRRVFIHLGFWGESVVIVGDEHDAQSLANYFKDRLQYGFLPVAVLSDQPCLSEPISPCPRLPICRIKELAHNLSVKTIMIVNEDRNNLDAVVHQYYDTFQWIILINDKFGNYGLTFLKPLDFLDILGFQVKSNIPNKFLHVQKRIIDIILSFLGLLFLAPLLTLIAIIIKLESGDDVFYRQRRLGKDRQTFTMLKFRTMHQNADKILKEELASCLELKKEWDKYQKLKKDPRITQTGRFLRKFSLDELPQLWNVFMGEMSLVGPRPIMVNQRAQYGETIEYYFQVNPGMTGLWQVSGRNQTSFERRSGLDLEYIQRWSVWLDIYILIKTIKTVILQEGAQ